MSSIQKRANGRWAVRWRDHDGQQRWTTFRTRAEAVDHRKVVDYELLTDGPSAIPIIHEPVTVDEYFHRWIPGQTWRRSTLDQVHHQYRRYVAPAFGHRQVDSIKHREAQRWVQDLSTGLAPATVRVVVAYVRIMFDDAERDRLIEGSPFRRLRLPKIPKTLVHPPTTAQVLCLHDGLPPRFRTLVTVAASSGMRQGELFGLSADRIDRDRQALVVDRQLTSTSEGVCLGPPKTRASVRVIPVPVELIDDLDDHIETFGLGSQDIVFSNEAGDPIRRNRFAETWAPVARSAGLPPRTGLHCLRHFYASLLIRSGCSVKVVQARLGHATAAETLDTYAHLWDDDDDRTRSAVQRFLVAGDVSTVSS